MGNFAENLNLGNRVRPPLADFLNFHQILHKFTLNFANLSFQVLKAWNIMYENT